MPASCSNGSRPERFGGLSHEETVDRLAAFAASVYTQEGQTFEAGIAQAMTAVLASPRFLFREEAAVAGSAEPFPLIDEFALASRLSYFLWSSMPDQELLRLAGAEQTQGKPPRPGRSHARRYTFR